MKGSSIAGKVFGRLTAIKPLRVSNKNMVWLCQCSCGKETEVLRTNLVSKRSNTRSCGCFQLDNVIALMTKHGGASIKGATASRCSAEYRAWRAMKVRCTVSSIKQFHNYGGRGIKVCDRWMDSFESFLEDMGRKPTSKHTLDRKDNDKDYAPDNCRWATYQEQALNKTTTFRIEGKTLHGWSIECGIPAERLKSRIGRGWGLLRATSQPLRRSPMRGRV
jgi:hypothetical protein